MRSRSLSLDHGADVGVRRPPGRRPASCLDRRHELGDEVVPGIAQRRRCAGRRCSSGRRTRTRSRRAWRPCRAGASSQTIAGVAFPSSSFTRLRCARSAIPQPTSPEPVNVISLTRSSSTSTSPIAAAEPETTFSQPGGRPASSSSSARNSAESGVVDAGFSTTGQPAASAGAILCATRFSGKLNGEIAPTIPIGSAKRERELSRACRRGVHRHHLAGELSRLDRGERVGRHGALRLDPRGLHRLAGLGARSIARGLLLPLVEQPRRRIEDRGALVCRQRRVERRARRRRARAASRSAPPFAIRPTSVAGIRRPHLGPLAGLDAARRRSGADGRCRRSPCRRQL